MICVTIHTKQWQIITLNTCLRIVLQYATIGLGIVRFWSKLIRNLGTTTKSSLFIFKVESDRLELN